MNPPARVGVLAVDDGARACCRPLLGIPRSVWFDPASSRAAEAGFWIETLRASGLRSLFCGTSDSEGGRAVESAVRRAARRVGVRIVALEDFPGNYWHLEAGEADVLVADSEASATHHRQRLGTRCPEIWVCPSPRYDAQRRAAPELRRRYASRTSARRAVLWAGQPETGDAIATLRQVLPALAGEGVELLFRAHPRDRGYPSGEYRSLFASSRIAVTDVTSLALGDCLALAPEALLTQFSSVGVEAGFHGIPSVHLLYPDAGGKTVHARKGYSVPPWCASGAALLIDRVEQQDDVIRRALHDDGVRDQTLRAFDDYFSTHAETLPVLYKRLYSHGFIDSMAPAG